MKKNTTTNGNKAKNGGNGKGGNGKGGKNVSKALPTAENAKAAKAANGQNKPAAKKAAKPERKILVKEGTRGILVPFARRWPEEGIPVITLAPLREGQKRVMVTSQKTFEKLSKEQQKTPIKSLKKEQVRATNINNLNF